MKTLIEIIAFSGVMFLLQSAGLFILIASVWSLRDDYRSGGIRLRESWPIIIAALAGALFGLGPGFLIISFREPKTFAVEAVVIAAFLLLVAPMFRESYKKPVGRKEPAADVFANLFNFSATAPVTPWWKRILSFLMNFVVAVLFVLAFNNVRSSFVQPLDLAMLMKVEFLVIHSFLFVAMVALAKPESWRGKAIQWYLFLAVIGLYILGALQEGGAAGVVVFLSATLATYIGFILNLTGPGAYSHLLKRWTMSFVLFMLWAVITGMDSEVENWHAGRQMFTFGFLYFLSLSAAELSGVYDIRLGKDEKSI